MTGTATINQAVRTVLVGQFAPLFAPGDKITNLPSGVLQVTAPEGNASFKLKTDGKYRFDNAGIGSGQFLFELSLEAPYSAANMSSALGEVLVSFAQPGRYTLELQFLNQNGMGGASIRAASAPFEVQALPVQHVMQMAQQDRVYQRFSFNDQPLFSEMSDPFSGIPGTVRLVIHAEDDTTVVRGLDKSQSGNSSFTLPSEIGINQANALVKSFKVTMKRTSSVYVEVFNDSVLIGHFTVDFRRKSVAASPPAIGGYAAAGGLVLGAVVAAVLRK